MEEEKKKNKFLPDKKHRIIAVILSALFVIISMFYGIAHKALGYETFTWNGSFQYSTNNWKYGTTSYCYYKWNGKSVKTYAGSNGFYRVNTGSSHDLYVVGDEAIPYLLSCGWNLRPGDTVDWSSNAEVTFKYSGVTSVTYPNVAAAEGNNNSSKAGPIADMEKNGIDTSGMDSTGPLLFVIEDDNGKKGYCHHFGGHWLTLQRTNSWTVEGVLLTVNTTDGGTTNHPKSKEYMPGDKVSVSATPNEGYTFDGWYEGSTKKSSNASYSFTMPSSRYTITAKFTKNNPEKYQLSVSWTAGGTVSGDSGEIEEGKNVTVVAKPSDGYSLTGWYEGETLKSTDKSYSFTMPSRNVTLDAKFEKGIVPPPPPPPVTEAPEPDEPETYSVSVIASGNGSVSGGGSYAVGDTVYLSASANYGSYFQNWSSSDCSISSIWYASTSFTMPANNVTVYGIFQDYGPNTVAYFTNGGGGTSFTEYTDSFDDYTHYVSAPKSNWTAPAGYIDFRTWSTQKNGGTEYNPGDLISYTGSYFTLYARWNPITYTVQFAGDDLNTVPEPTLSPQQTWAYDEPSPMPGEPYDKKYTVNYDLNKKSGMSTTPAFTQPTSLSSSNTIADFTFDGWLPYHYENGVYVTTGMSVIKEGEKQNLTTKADDRIILFPQWKGGVILPVVSCTGYNFHGWVTDKDETDITKALVASPYGQTYSPPRNNITLYAQLLPKTYPINLDRQDPDLNLIETVIMTFDAYGPDVPVPKRLHYTFQGYYTQPGGNGVKYYDNTGKGTKLWQIDDGSIDTLYAYWVLDTQIIYDKNSGIGYMADTWLDGNATSVVLPKNSFSKYGYTFSKWTTNADGSGTAYADGATVSGIPVSSVIKLYAQWSAESSTVIFNASPGTVTETSRVVQYNSAYKYDAQNKINKALPVPTPPAGYSWYKDADGNGWFMTDTSEGINAETIVSRTGNHTVYAKYVPNDYTVTFDWNFDYERTAVNKKTNWSGDTKTVTYDSAFGSLPVPTRDGYTFAGWWTSRTNGNGSGTEVTAGTVMKTASNITVYAKWVNNEYVLNFDYNLDYRVDPNN